MKDAVARLFTVKSAVAKPNGKQRHPLLPNECAILSMAYLTGASYSHVRNQLFGLKVDLIDGISSEELCLALVKLNLHYLILDASEVNPDSKLSVKDLIDLAKLGPGLVANHSPGGALHICAHDGELVLDDTLPERLTIENWRPQILILLWH